MIYFNEAVSEALRSSGSSLRSNCSVVRMNRIVAEETTAWGFLAGGAE